jgi:hypothetical protein
MIIASPCSTRNPNSAQSLDNDARAPNPGLQAESAHLRVERARLSYAVEHSETRGLFATTDAPERDGLTCHASDCVQFVVVQLLIGVDHPCHLASAGAEVGCRRVNAGADEVLLREFERVAASNPLEFTLGVGVTVDPDAALRTAERHVHHGALVGHKRSESFDVVCADIHAVSNATLGWQLVVAVFHPPAVDIVERPVVPAQRERHLVDAVAPLDLLQQRRIVLREAPRAVAVAIDLIREADVVRAGLRFDRDG